MSENRKKAGRNIARSRVWRHAKKLLKGVLLTVLLLTAGLFGLRAYITSRAASDDGTPSYARASVQSGAMRDTVYGTGTTSARNQPSILAEADGTLTELRVSIGDAVQAGDVLAVIANEALDDTITDYEFALWELDDTIQDTAAGSNVLTVRAPMAGRVMALYGEVGEDTLAVFRREGKLAVISTDGRMKVVLSDVPVAAKLRLNDAVQVRGETVDAVGAITDLTLQGTQATITILDDTLPMGEAVTVYAASGEALGTGVLEVNKPMEVSAYGGTIAAVRAKVGQKVERRDILFGLEDSPLTLTMENLRLQRETAARDLENAKAQRENLIVLAPCDGTVASLDVKEGDAITSGMILGSILQGEDMKLTIAVDELDVVDVAIGQSVTITIDALSDLALTGEVDKVAPVGSNSGGVTTYSVELAFDAAGKGVRSGMNATGEIEVASKASTLYVPVEAIMTISNRTYVMVEDGGTQSLSSAAQSVSSADRRSRQSGMTPGGFDRSSMPEGFAPSARGGAALPENSAQEEEKTGFDGKQMLASAVSAVRGAYDRVMAWLYEDVQPSADTVTGTLVEVTVGMQNEDYAEILSGVSAGQTVLYTDEDAGSSSSSFRMGNMGGFGGRMGF